jgi:hypothetical protein
MLAYQGSAGAMVRVDWHFAQVVSVGVHLRVTAVGEAMAVTIAERWADGAVVVVVSALGA